MTEQTAGYRSGGAERIAAERQRQVDAEGWTPEHDAEHSARELIRAARGYLHGYEVAHRKFGYAERDFLMRGTHVPPDWPWWREDWKPTPDDPLRMLVKAGALIAAEIDRVLHTDSKASA